MVDELGRDTWEGKYLCIEGRPSLVIAGTFTFLLETDLSLRHIPQGAYVCVKGRNVGGDVFRVTAIRLGLEPALEVDLV